MFKKILIVFVVIAGSCFGTFCGNASADAGDIFWNGNISCSWSDYGNWWVEMYPDPPGDCCVPNNLSNVILNNAETVCLDTSGTTIINSLTNSGDSVLWIETGWNPCLKMVNFHNQGELDIAGHRDSRMEITSSVVNDAGARLQISYDLSFDGNITFSNAGELNVRKAVKFHFSDGTFINTGMIQVDTASELEVGNLQNYSTVNIHGGELNAQSDLINEGAPSVNMGSITGWGVVYGKSSFQNQAGSSITASIGTLRLVTEGTISNNGIIKNLPMSSLDIVDLSPPTDVMNSGTIEVNTGGGVAVHSNLYNSNSIQLLGGALSANTITESSGAIFSGFGNITANIVIENNGTIQLTGPTNIIGDVTIGSNATLEVRDGQTLVTGHTTNNGTIYIIGGTIIFQGGLTDNGDIIRESSSSINAADFNYSGGVDGSDLAVFASEFGWTAEP